MVFLQAEYLYLMLLPSLVLFYVIVTHQSKVEGVFSKEMLERLKIDNQSLGRIGRNIFLFLGLFFFLLSLARPAIYDAKVSIKQMRSTLFVLFDISASMKAGDFYPNRLSVAKAKFDTLIQKNHHIDMGVGAFAHDFFLVSPVTNDMDILHYFVDNLDFTSLSRSGTNMLVALEGAQRVLKEQKEKNVLIFSDGGEEKEFSQAIAYAKKHNMHVYIDALSSSKGAPIPTDDGLVKDEKGNIVLSHTNPAFKTLALETEGAYIDATLGSADVEALIKAIANKAQKQEEKQHDEIRYLELFYYPLGLAIVFLVIAFSSLPVRKERAG